tara:strand:+ start:875 stop:2821 length:1947 start_codon:yes stop_codon:yes gene_type:complete
MGEITLSWKPVDLSYKDNRSDKVYKIDVVDNMVKIEYGRTGSKLRVQEKSFDNNSDAVKFAKEKEKDKRSKGYTDTDSPFISTRKLSKRSGPGDASRASFMNPKVMKAKRFKDHKKKVMKQGYQNYGISEKLDGFRAVWDGEKFLSKDGNTFDAPSWFTDGLPKNIKLDGELWTGRDSWESVASIARTSKDSPKYDESRWANVQYMIFDSPTLYELEDGMGKMIVDFESAYDALLSMSEPRYIGEEMVLAWPYRSFDHAARARNLKSKGKYMWTKKDLVSHMREMTDNAFPNSEEVRKPMNSLIEMFQAKYDNPPYNRLSSNGDVLQPNTMPNTYGTFFYDSKSQIEDELDRQKKVKPSIKTVGVYETDVRETVQQSVLGTLVKTTPYKTTQHGLTIDADLVNQFADVPVIGAGIEENLWLNENTLPHRYRVVPQIRYWNDLEGTEDGFNEFNDWLDDFLSQNIVPAGGEGIMLRDMKEPYEYGDGGSKRSNNIFKVKPVDTEEGIVSGYEEGLGRNKGRVGSLVLELKDNPEIKWKLGSGLNDEIRENPPPIGSEVEYLFTGKTKRGIPKEARFSRVRKPSSWNNPIRYNRIRNINGNQFAEIGVAKGREYGRFVAQAIRSRTGRNVRVIPKARGYSIYVGNVRRNT